MLYITSIKSKETKINPINNCEIPTERWDGDYEILCQDSGYVYIRVDNNHCEVPYVWKRSKAKYTFWNNDTEIIFN